MSSTRSSRVRTSRDGEADNPPSSSSTSLRAPTEERQSRKRVNQNEEGKNEIDSNSNENNSNTLNLNSNKVYITYPVKLSAKDIGNWNKQTKDAQDLCIKRVMRFVLYRSSDKEHQITRDKIGDVLTEIDGSYKNLTTPCIHHVQEILKKDFGYALTEQSDIIGIEATKSKSYYLINDMQSQELHKILASVNHDACFIGFCYIVLVAVYTSVNSQAKVKDVLSSVRQIDSRFPATLPDDMKKRSTTAVAVPELKLDFIGLLSRMKKEGYIEMKASDVTDQVNMYSMQVVSLGPRFYAEFGNERLVSSYYQGVDEPISKQILEGLRNTRDTKVQAIMSDRAKTQPASASSGTA